MKAVPASPSMEFLRLPQSSPLSPLQLQHTVPSPRAGTVAFVHINPPQPLSCKESLSGFSQPTHQGLAGTDSRLPSGDVHVSSWSHPMPSGPLAAFLSLHRQSSFPSQRIFSGCSATSKVLPPAVCKAGPSFISQGSAHVNFPDHLVYLPSPHHCLFITFANLLTRFVYSYYLF